MPLTTRDSLMIDLTYSDEQSQVASSIQALVTREFPLRRLATPAGGGDLDKWALMAGQGWFGLGLPGDRGGIGYGPVEETILLQQAARGLVTPSLLATILAVRAADALNDAPLRDALLAGDSRAALAFGTAGDGSGRAIQAEGADVFLSWDASGLQLIDARAVTMEPRGSADPSLTLHRFIAPGNGVRRCEDPALVDLAELCAAAVLLGIAEETAARATDYAGTREQFGQPIGRFQSIKHICAEMATRAEALRAQVCYAAIMLDAGTPMAPAEVSAARLVARDYAWLNCEANIQVHGAIGFTQEFDAHFFLKRANLMNLAGPARADSGRMLMARAAG